MSSSSSTSSMSSISSSSSSSSMSLFSSPPSSSPCHHHRRHFHRRSRNRRHRRHRRRRCRPLPLSSSSCDSLVVSSLTVSWLQPQEFLSVSKSGKIGQFLLPLQIVVFHNLKCSFSLIVEQAIRRQIWRICTPSDQPLYVCCCLLSGANWCMPRPSLTFRNKPAIMDFIISGSSCSDNNQFSLTKFSGMLKYISPRQKGSQTDFCYC